jgi:hypothetical protein
MNFVSLIAPRGETKREVGNEWGRRAAWTLLAPFQPGAERVPYFWGASALWTANLAVFHREFPIASHGAWWHPWTMTAA